MTDHVAFYEGGVLGVYTNGGDETVFEVEVGRPADDAKLDAELSRHGWSRSADWGPRIGGSIAPVVAR